MRCVLIMVERVLISCQSDIKDGMTHIGIRIDCNVPLIFPASLKRLRIFGEYDWQLSLPDGLEVLELGPSWEKRAVKLPNSVKQVIRGYKDDRLTERTKMIMFVGSECWFENIFDFADMGDRTQNRYCFPRLNIDGLNVKYYAYTASLTMAGVCKIRGYGKDVAKIFYRLFHSNMCAWYSYYLKDEAFRSLNIKKISQ